MRAGRWPIAALTPALSRPPIRQTFAWVVERLQTILEAARPTRLLVVHDGSVYSAAAATSAALMGLRVERLGQPEGGRESVSSRLLSAVSEELRVEPGG